MARAAEAVRISHSFHVLRRERLVAPEYSSSLILADSDEQCAALGVGESRHVLPQFDIASRSVVAQEPTDEELAELKREFAIAPLSPNDLRRTCATWLRQHQTEPHLIGAFLGHKDSRMAERVYGRIPVESLGAALGQRVGDRRDAFVPATGKSRGTMGRAARAKRPLFSQKAVPRDGIEPPTRGFSIPCSHCPPQPSSANKSSRVIAAAAAAPSSAASASPRFFPCSLSIPSSTVSFAISR